MGKNYNRISTIKPFLKSFNFENTNYPVKKEDYEIFERDNEPFCLIVFKLDNERKKVYYHFKSKNLITKNKIFLLLLKDKHYTYVTKPHLLLKYIEH